MRCPTALLPALLARAARRRRSASSHNRAMSTSSKLEGLTISDVLEAASRISPHVHRTPVLTCATFDQWAGRSLFFKCENLQKTGSFKARGAANAVLKAKEEYQKMGKTFPGMVTHSSGNHAQASAWASSIAGVPCTVVVPNDTPQSKCRAVEGYGAKLVFCQPSPTSRKETCERVSRETGSVFISSCDDYDVMAGQGTMALELHEQVPSLDAVLVTCSGGGMAAGVAVATRAVNPGCKVIVVEPEGKELGPCLRAKRRLWQDPPQFVDTIAEGIRLQQLGHRTFPIVCEYAEQEVITVTDGEMVEAMRWAAERMKLVLEAAAGAALAAAIKLGKQEGMQAEALKRVGVVLCGGNVNVGKLPWM